MAKVSPSADHKGGNVTSPIEQSSLDPEQDERKLQVIENPSRYL